jgi:glycerophosphoryl diester phosphodiesterase
MTRLATLHGQSPIVIAHRGASGPWPEHTRPAYLAALDSGAEAVEPDVVMSADGHLIVRHDRYLSASTDVADRPEFAARRVRKPGRDTPDWYAEDFTLSELRRLRARQPFPGRSTAEDGRHGLLTLEELLGLLREAEHHRGATIGFHPEIKHPDYLLSAGLDVAPPLLRALAAHGYDAARGDLFVQSFDLAFLRRLRPLTDIRLTMLLEPRDGRPHVPVETAAEVAAAIGPWKQLLIDPATGRSTGLLEQAHALGLLVHAWTFRDDAVGDGFADVAEELRAYLALGLDGAFADFPATAVAVRDGFLAGRRAREAGR